MTHRDRAGAPPGRREAAGDAGHRQGFPTPAGGSPARPERGCTKAFGRCPAWLAMPRIAARHALLAESLGKPSLWVIINAPWYKWRLRCSVVVFLFPALGACPRNRIWLDGWL